MTRRGGGWFIGGLVGCAAVVAVLLGLSVIDSPGNKRMQRLDAQRVEDMGAIVAAVDRYWSAHNDQLPGTLDEIAGDVVERYSISDRVTDLPYDYRIETPRSYRLCARFDTEGAHALPTYFRLNRRTRIEAGTIHGAGVQCFAIRRSPP